MCASWISPTSYAVLHYIADGARFLAHAALYFPAGTIFVGVVDTGVDTQRRAVIAKSKRGRYFVVPDHGLLTFIENSDGIAGAREITNPAWRWPGPMSAPFHGRDIFPPPGAHLARGADWTGAGARSASPRPPSAQVRDDRGRRDHRPGRRDGPFGNLITDVKAELFQKLGYRLGDRVHIRVGRVELTVPYVTTFGDVPIGQPLLCIDSSGFLSDHSG